MRTTRASVLIIEDDPVLQRGLRDNFGFKGYRVSTASDGQAGLDAALERQPDLILLDIMLPKVNGFEICRRIREAQLDMPIIMLTAKGQEEDIVRGLNLGADDYVTKPFGIKELLARAAAFLRRHGAEAEEVYRFGSFRLDLASYQLLKNGTEVPLTPKELRLLEYLLRRAGRALTRDEIMDAVWGTGVLVTARSVDRCVTTLRSKIEPDPHHPRHILTIRDIGYRFRMPEPEGETPADDDPVPLPPGSRLGRYEIGELIGSGGMGQIFRARDCHLERDVAVKVLSRRWARHRQAVVRFEREARVVASLAHPSILSIFDVGTDHGLTYLVTELLHGEALSERIARCALGLPQAIEIGIAMAEALAVAHAKGVIHRDIKPSNVFLTADSGIRLLDFGLAQVQEIEAAADGDSPTLSLLTSPGAVLGTLDYMAPEQVRGLPTDPRSDVFSVGCVLYEMICGAAPFTRDTPADTMAAILLSDPPPLERAGEPLPADLVGVVERCLQREREARYPDAQTLAQALAAVDAGVAASAIQP